MEKIAIIKNLISLVNLTSEEVTALVRELIADYGLDAVDCIKQSGARDNNGQVSSAVQDLFADTSCEASETSGTEDTACGAGNGQVIVFDDNPHAVSDEQVKTTKSRRGRPKKVKAEDAGGETVTEVQAKSRRGRPKKVKAEDAGGETVTEVQAKSRRGRPKKVKAEDINSEREALAEAAKIEAALNSEKDDDGNVNQTFQRLADYPELNAQAFGSKQPFAFLYKWNGRNVLSNYVLSGMMPIGIYIPYKSIMFGKYRGFVVSLYDEKVITDAGEAFNEAERAFEPVDGEMWSIMNSLQWGVLKNNQDIVSHMFRKVGGDGLCGAYKTVSPRSKSICGIGNFRYTVDVK